MAAAAAARPTAAMVEALRAATSPELTHQAAVALLTRARNDLSWASNFYWEGVEQQQGGGQAGEEEEDDDGYDDEDD